MLSFRTKRVGVGRRGLGQGCQAISTVHCRSAEALCWYPKEQVVYVTNCCSEICIERILLRLVADSCTSHQASLVWISLLKSEIN